MLENECFEAAEACVSPSAKRPAKSETTLWNTYIQISSAPHTSHRTLSMPLTKLYIYRAVDGRWALFSWYVYLTYGKKKKTRGFIEAQCGPLVTGRGSADALQRFSSLSLLPGAVLSFCSHTVWAFTVKSAADLRRIQHTEVASKGLLSSIWRGRWFTMLVSLISQWVKTFAVCLWF